MNQSPRGIFRGWNRAFMAGTVEEDESTHFTEPSYRTGTVTTASSRGSTVGYSTDGLSYDSEDVTSGASSFVSSDVGLTTSLLKKATSKARSLPRANLNRNNRSSVSRGKPGDADSTATSPARGNDKYSGLSTQKDIEEDSIRKENDTALKEARYTARTDLTGYAAHASAVEHCENSTGSKGANAEYTRDQSNRLHELIEEGGWEEILKIIDTPRGKQMAAVPHPWGNGDLPIHLVVGYDFDLREREKRIRKTRQAERKAKIKSRAKARGEAVDSSDSEAADSYSECGEEQSEERSQERTMPPPEVIMEVMKAYPSAIRTKGHEGCLPLHHAARLNYPKEIFVVLIRAYPQGLDVRDNNKLTPRDHDNHLADAEVQSLLDRPSSCWIQQIRDEETHSNMDDELRALEKDVKVLTDDLTKCIEEEQALQKRLVQIEDHFTRFSAYRQGQELEKRAEALQESMEKEAAELRSRIEGLFGFSSLKYVEDEKEREYIASFNDDVSKIYSNANEGLEEMKIEVTKLVRSM